MSITEQLRALNEIDRFDEPTFRRATAALKRLHPEQYDCIFGDGLSPTAGPASVGSVQLFLERYAALRDGSDPNREDERDPDKAAARTLERRNIVTRTIEAEMRSLIAVVQLSAPIPVSAQISASEEALQDAATEFEALLSDWCTTASAGIHRRDYRIILGISKRRAPVECDNHADPDAPPQNATQATVMTQAQRVVLA